MIVYLIDTSAWIDYLRDTGSKAATEVERLIDTDSDIATTEPIAMELLAGATDSKALTVLDALTTGLPLIRVDPHSDYHHAAAIYRTARSQGKTVRSMIDCLVAAVALRSEATVVHKDADFDAIAGFAPLDVVSLR
ncbi:MAG: PIN domain nuclease [Sporichthyaceae bacterium]|nr:PIN domain nuclease [Sporichthyaceae bacterium]